MKKNKLMMGLAMGLTAFSSQIHADDSWGWSDNTYCEYDDCCSESKFLVAAEFLWWTPGTYLPFANNVFSNVGNGVVSPTAPFPSVTDTILSPYTRISEKWSPGVRVGLGWESCEGDWQLWGVWTGYSNYARRLFHSRPPVPSPTTPTTNIGLLERPVGAEVFSNALLPIAGSEATATYKLNYNVADLVFGKSIECSYGIELVPYVGVRAAFFHQRNSVFFDGIDVVAGPFTAEIRGSTKVDEELWCVGPRLGLEASWGEWCGFSLLGNISAAVLYGHLEEDVSASLSAPNRRNEVTVINLTRNYLTHDRYNQIVPNLQVQLGFGYKIDFDMNCSPYSIDVFAMWEGNAYWAASNYLFRERELGLNGLTTGFTFSW